VSLHSIIALLGVGAMKSYQMVFEYALLSERDIIVRIMTIIAMDASEGPFLTQKKLRGVPSAKLVLLALRGKQNAFFVQEDPIKITLANQSVCHATIPMEDMMGMGQTQSRLKGCAA